MKYYPIKRICEAYDELFQIKISEREEGKSVSKGNCIYRVVVYVGEFTSHDTKVVYTTSKESNAERFLHAYLKEHTEVNKAFIERTYGRTEKRNAKYMREDYEY